MQYLPLILTLAVFLPLVWLSYYFGLHTKVWKKIITAVLRKFQKEDVVDFVIVTGFGVLFISAFLVLSYLYNQDERKYELKLAKTVSHIESKHPSLQLTRVKGPLQFSSIWTFIGVQNEKLVEVVFFEAEDILTTQDIDSSVLDSREYEIINDTNQ